MTSPSNAETELLASVNAYFELWHEVCSLEAQHGPYYPPIGWETQDIADPKYHPAEWVLADMEWHEMQIDRLTNILEVEC